MMDNARQARVLQGRRCLVTGGNRGLGKGVAKHLHEFGCEVTVATRTPGNVPLSANASAKFLPLDLSQLKSVCAAASASDVYDVVVLNAGVAPYKNDKTAEGLEQALGTNCLGNFAFVLSLLAEGRVAAGARVVVVNSETHRAVPRLNVSSLREDVSYGLTDALQYYARSKLCLTTLARALARTLAARGLAVHTICPGPVATDLARDAPDWVRPAIEAFMHLAFQTPEQAGRAVALVAADPLFAGPTGSHHHMFKSKDARADTADAGQQRALWQLMASVIREHPPACFAGIEPFLSVPADL
jgi:NAD(P)-dependent dehydrogenase (short-subunit alcohol dehydrogenase family)